MDELILTEEARAVIVNDAESTYPHECCGFLYGSDDEQRIITLAEEVNNTREENRERRFEISAQDYMKAEEYADNNDLTLLGVYHSHPEHPAIPSQHDLIRALPYFSYIIASVKDGKTAKILSWKLNDEGKFEEEKVIERASDINIDQLLTELNN